MAARKPLNRQVLVITGASAGLGLSTALRAAERGARVVLAARSQDSLHAVVEQITQAGGQALAVGVDVGVREQVDGLARASIEHFGRIDAWVNGADISIHGQLDEVDEQDGRHLFDINFWGVVNGSLAALPYLRASGGTLVNIGGDAGSAENPDLGMDVAAKHAVTGFTTALRVQVEEIEGAPVRVALIEPTTVATLDAQNTRIDATGRRGLQAAAIDVRLTSEAILDVVVDGVRGAHVVAMPRVITPTAAQQLASGGHLAAVPAASAHEDRPWRTGEGNGMLLSGRRAQRN